MPVITTLNHGANPNSTMDAQGGFINNNISGTLGNYQ